MKKFRMKTRDVAFAFRMGAGFPGEVTRSHPTTIEPALICAATPPTQYGQAVLVDATTQGVRPYAAGDQSNTVPSGYGITVRPFPTQQAAASNFGTANFGSVAPPPNGSIDLLRSGYIMGFLSNGGTPVKGNPVYIWAAVSSGNHVQGGFEAAFSSGNTTQLLNATFNGSPDASGNVEIAFNI